MDREAIIEILEANRETLRRFGVRSLSLFGSTVRGEARADSDVDVLVEFEPGARVGLFAFSRLQRCLEGHSEDRWTWPPRRPCTGPRARRPSSRP